MTDGSGSRSIGRIFAQSRRRPVSRYDKIRGLGRQAGTEPQSWETGQMDFITYIGLDVHKTTIAVAVARRIKSKFYLIRCNLRVVPDGAMI